MIETVFITVVVFILLLLAAIEVWHYRSLRATGWEAGYYSRRLRRRLLGLGLLLVILLAIHFHDQVRPFLKGLFWNLAYISVCLLFILAVFLLLVKDLVETARFAVRKQSDIAAQSIRRLRKTMNEMKRDDGESRDS